MRFDSRNLLIIVMFLMIVSLMVLMYKINRLVVDRIPNHIRPEVYVMGLTKAVEQQNRVCTELAHQAHWLRRHLDKCLMLIESERGLEPIPTKFDMLKDPMVGKVLTGEMKKGPFVIPYEKYSPPSQDSEPEERNLMTLTCMTNLATLGANMASPYAMDEVIDDFQQRLRRIAPDPNSLPDSEIQ